MSQNQGPVPGRMFGVPKLGTTRRLVPDNGNESLGASPSKGSQTKVQTTQFDQLDIVQGWKLPCTLTGKWTQGSGKTVHQSPFGIAASIQSLNVKLQAAYSTFNLNGPLAALAQGYRPMWGSRTPSQDIATTDPFAACQQVTVDGADHSYPFTVDIPAAIKIDEYYNLTASGDPQQRIMDAIVSPFYMAAQARNVTPSLYLNPMMATADALEAPTTIAVNDNTSVFADGAFLAGLWRDSYFTSNNVEANPIQYPWLYTRDMFTQATQGQNKVGILIQNTATSVGQVLSLWGFVWDPDANSGFGALVPFSSIATFEFVTGGTLQNRYLTPQVLENDMFTRHPELATLGPWANGAGAFLLDFAMSTDGAYLTNANAINTYVTNGVALNIVFNNGQAPGPNATVYVGVEALKLVTS